MTGKIIPILCVLLLAVSGLIQAAPPLAHHKLQVRITPAENHLWVRDEITGPACGKEKPLHFLLHGNLKITSCSAGISIKKESGQLTTEFSGINTAQFEIEKKIPIQHYSITFQSDTAAEKTFFLEYEGKINHPIKKNGGEYARGFSETPGIIDGKGAYLAGASFWYPWFNDNLFTYHMETTVPKDWDTVSQGKRAKHDISGQTRITTWDSPEPMDEIYLSAAKFKEYSIKVGKVDVLAFLRSEDRGLANKYLETTGQYLEMYERLIGRYPYSKFALIENFWETGYGMPSFTLLGPKIIRFPFILHSSYPHELLHNWWGNSVFVDYEKGNWCEGLTVLLADHMIKQQRGQGAEYRKSTLQGYTHYAAGKPGEFPLSRFKARYDALSSAIGYGKSMMMFHMLRGLVGDKVFKKAVSVFYRDNKFKRAGFDDIKAAFESTSQIDLDAFFHQWVQRTGIPELRISAAAVEKKGNSYVLGFSLLQSQNIGSADLHGGKDNLQAAGRPYTLRIPVAVHLEGQKEAVLKYPVLSKTKEDFQYEFTHRPLGVDIDPQFDVFRKLHESEIPPTLSNAFGADAALMLLPSAAPAELLKAYRTLAETWAGESKEKITIQMDKEITRLPPDKAVWLLGKENIHRHKVAKGIEDYGAAMEAGTFKVEKRSFALSGNAVIAAIKNPGNPRNVIVSLSSHTPAALPGLARKLPHYGKYSYLGFDGDEPTNILKGQWPVVNSPMTVSLDSSFSGGTLPKSNPLARLAPLFSEERMMKHVSYLASEELEGRGLGYKGLEKAAHYIAVAFRKAGLQPAGDKNSYIQSWEEEVKGRGKILLKNVIAKIPGTNPALKNRPVILCAHYDHLGLGWPDVHKGDEGKIHPGADDNASGVAVMLELAHTLGKSLEPQRPLVFIAFTGEENGLMGSTHYVKKQIEKGSAIMAAVNLDTVGRLPDKTPYMVIGSSSAREWKYIFMGIGFTIGVESRMAQQLDSSDQTAFIRAGIPAVHLFSGPHADYHRPTDTIDKIIPAGLVKIASATREAILYLAERKEPLTNTIKNTKSATGSTSHKGTHGKAPSHGEGASSHGNASSRTGGRRVRTGMMPDFSFSGKGMKVGAVSPDSAAAKAGLKKGDIITAVAKVEVTDLRSYSTQLKKFKPGDIVIMEFLREEKKHTASITLEAR